MSELTMSQYESDTRTIQHRDRRNRIGLCLEALDRMSGSTVDYCLVRQTLEDLMREREGIEDIGAALKRVGTGMRKDDG